MSCRSVSVLVCMGLHFGQYGSGHGDLMHLMGKTARCPSLPVPCGVSHEPLSDVSCSHVE